MQQAVCEDDTALISLSGDNALLYLNTAEDLWLYHNPRMGFEPADRLYSVFHWLAADLELEEEEEEDKKGGIKGGDRGIVYHSCKEGKGIEKAGKRDYFEHGKNQVLRVNRARTAPALYPSTGVTATTSPDSNRNDGSNMTTGGYGLSDFEKNLADLEFQMDADPLWKRPVTVSGGGRGVGAGSQQGKAPVGDYPSPSATSASASPGNASPSQIPLPSPTSSSKGGSSGSIASSTDKENKASRLKKALESSAWYGGSGTNNSSSGNSGSLLNTYTKSKQSSGLPQKQQPAPAVPTSNIGNRSGTFVMNRAGTFVVKAGEGGGESSLSVATPTAAVTLTPPSSSCPAGPAAGGYYRKETDKDGVGREGQNGGGTGRTYRDVDSWKNGKKELSVNTAVTVDDPVEVSGFSRANIPVPASPSGSTKSEGGRAEWNGAPQLNPMNRASSASRIPAYTGSGGSTPGGRPGQSFIPRPVFRPSPYSSPGVSPSASGRQSPNASAPPSRSSSKYSSVRHSPSTTPPYSKSPLQFRSPSSSTPGSRIPSVNDIPSTLIQTQTVGGESSEKSRPDSLSSTRKAIDFSKEVSGVENSDMSAEKDWLDGCF
eukprot:Nk52_evm31s485 gene=Nk52_evmTU31s485